MTTPRPPRCDAMTDPHHAAELAAYRRGLAAGVRQAGARVVLLLWLWLGCGICLGWIAARVWPA